jgi:hypothetical protein
VIAALSRLLPVSESGGDVPDHRDGSELGVARGRERIEHELSHSLILPAVAQTIRSIFGLLEAAHTALASRPPT